MGAVLPQPSHFSETLSTLSFVALAKAVKTNPQLNFETKESGRALQEKIATLLATIDNLKREGGPADAQLKATVQRLLSSNKEITDRLDALIDFQSDQTRIKVVSAGKSLEEKLQPLRVAYEQMSQFLTKVEFEKEEEKEKTRVQLSGFQTVLNKFIENIDLPQKTSTIANELLAKLKQTLENVDRKFLAVKSVKKVEAGFFRSQTSDRRKPASLTMTNFQHKGSPQSPSSAQIQRSARQLNSKVEMDLFQVDKQPSIIAEATAGSFLGSFFVPRAKKFISANSNNQNSKKEENYVLNANSFVERDNSENLEQRKHELEEERRRFCDQRDLEINSLRSQIKQLQFSLGARRDSRDSLPRANNLQDSFSRSISRRKSSVQKGVDFADSIISRQQSQEEKILCLTREKSETQTAKQKLEKEIANF